MLSILIICYSILTINCFSIDLIEKDYYHSIEKLLLINDKLFLGTIHSLHCLSTNTLNETILSLKLPLNYHWKILLSINNENLLICGTISQGICQLLDKNFNIIINSSLPVVANDPINSTIGLFIPEKNLVYFGVTYTNEGMYRWQIPNISGRSLNISRFMKIFSENDDEIISRDDLSLRFMSRQQTTFIVQYIATFSTKNYIYFLTNQPNDIEHKTIQTKILRFCRQTSHSIIRTYSEIPLICFDSDWILKNAEIINNEILLGHFTRKDGTGGTNICSWNIINDIDQAFTENYRRCYSKGIGQRGLAFIKPNEYCRKDESWSISINEENLCPWIISDRLPYPVGGIKPVIGRLIYENILESSSAFQMFSFGSLILVFQGLTNATLKLGLFDFRSNINWFYSSQLSSHLPILSPVLFERKMAKFFFASGSKIYRISMSNDCTSRLSCDECLSSSTNPLGCGWCTMNQRCTLINQCSKHLWQQEKKQCTQIVEVQPLKASIDYNQWINLTFSKLPSLEHNEIYQCIFKDKTLSAHSQAIKLDHNRLSCPTPSHVDHISRSIVRLSIIKWPSNISIAIVPKFTLYNCSAYSSCLTCRSEIGCQWCSQRCSSMCNEPLSECPLVNLVNSSKIFFPANQPARIPLNLKYLSMNYPIECRLNGTILGSIDSKNICFFSKIPDINNENHQPIYLTIHQNDILIGQPLELFIFQCHLYESCDQCNLHEECLWCRGRCSIKSMEKCSINEKCTSLKIKNFSPKILPLNGKTIITIDFNENFQEEIIEIILIDEICLIINTSNKIQCQSTISNISKKGQIIVRLTNSIYILSKDNIEYRQPLIISINPHLTYQSSEHILNIHGENLLIGNEQKLFLGNFSCPIMKSNFPDTISCRLPSIIPGIYNITIHIDQQIIFSEQTLKITGNPLVQDIDPTVSFASGGRLVTIRGMNFASVEMITVKFSYQKWNAKLKINSNDIIIKDDEITSLFAFRTPAIPSPSNDFPSPPFDVNLSIYFDNSSISLINLIQFHYIPDVLLNISNVPPTLPYTGEELKLQVENLTDAASLSDIQLFIGCSECKLKTFNSKGITCQPPKKLIGITSIILNNQDDCTLYNTTIGPIRFRIGYREYLIGYLSYTRINSSKTSIISLIFASLLLTIALLTLTIYLCYKFRKTPSNCSLKPEENEKQFWSTDTSASTCPYYQVYEQISSISSHDNTLTRAPFLFCSYYHDKHSNLSIQNSQRFLSTISIDNEQLKTLFYLPKYSSNVLRTSMEFFYDLLNMKPFSQAFLDHLIEQNSYELQLIYIYIFRYNPQSYQNLPQIREILLAKFFSTLFHQTQTELISQFHIFDDLLRIIIEYIDSAPNDEILHRSIRSISSTTFLPQIIPYNSLQLTIDYENFLRFHLSVLDCDTINQIKYKILHYFNSHENTHRLIDYEQLDLIIPSLNICLCKNQVPMIKNYIINSTICCRKRLSIKYEKNIYDYHLCQQEYFNDDYREKLMENKKQLEDILRYFYQQIINGLELFQIWTNEFSHENDEIFFKKYIEVVSDFIRRLNCLMLIRSNCPIIQSFLNVIADGLEWIFETKDQVSLEIEELFFEEKKYFSQFQRKKFHSRPSNLHLSTMDIRQLILTDQYAIECLFKLYQFYEIHSESINQQIGENHVSVLLPVHHLLVQIRQLLQSDTTTLI